MKIYPSNDFGPEAKAKYLELMATSFSAEAVERKRVVWDWLFGHPYIQSIGGANMLIMEDDSRWLGVCLLNADQVYLDGEIYNGAFPTAVCVHPESRGRRGIVFSKKIFTVETEGVTIGMPNSERYALLLQRTGTYLTPKRYQRFVPLRYGQVAANRKSVLRPLASVGDLVGQIPLQIQKLQFPKLKADETLTRETHFDDEYDEFWEAAKSSYKFCVARHATRMNWRYVDIPINEYEIYFLRRAGEIVGYVVTSIRQEGHKSVGHVIDIFVKHRTVRDYALLFSRAVEVFRKAKADFGVVSYMMDEALDSAAKQVGFSVSKRKLQMIVSHVTGADIAPTVLEHLGEIYFQRGDHDEDY